MVDQIQSTIDSQSLVLKLKSSLDRINTRLANTSNASIASALSEANAAFKLFFDNLKDPGFTPEFFIDGDTARSETYNNNLKSLSEDLERFYVEMKSLSNAQLKSFNFSQIVVSEITKRANALASTVLDLNILNSYNRSDTIIAGDDFKTSDYIDSSAALASSKASIVSNGSGLALAIEGSQNIIQNASIDVIPLAPTDKSTTVTSKSTKRRFGANRRVTTSKVVITPTSTVNSEPTAGNIQRFYEGCYYNFIGLARPEGGQQFNIQYMVDPSSVKESQDPSTAAKEVGLYVELGAPEDVKKQSRLKMLDGNPSTFWECEYLYRVPRPLIPDIPDSIVKDNDSSNGDGSIQSGTVKIDLESAEKAAQGYDTDLKDLVIDLVVTFPSQTSVNYVSINPVIFGSDSFPEVEDIATSDSAEGEFKTVDGWESIRFPKVLTPEANEFLTDSQLAATLAPTRNSYLGQGVFSFPVRFAKKLKIRIRSRKPVPAPYERTYALLKRQLEEESVITTTTKKGAFRF